MRGAVEQGLFQLSLASSPLPLPLLILLTAAMLWASLTPAMLFVRLQLM
jgi:hypothetical protein